MKFGTLSPMWQNVRMVRLEAHSRGATCEAGEGTGRDRRGCGLPATFMLAWIGAIPHSRRECRHHARESLRRIAAAKETRPAEWRADYENGMRRCTSCGLATAPRVCFNCGSAATYVLSDREAERWELLGDAAFMSSR